MGYAHVYVCIAHRLCGPVFACGSPHRLQGRQTFAWLLECSEEEEDEDKEEVD